MTQHAEKMKGVQEIELQKEIAKMPLLSIAAAFRALNAELFEHEDTIKNPLPVPTHSIPSASINCNIARMCKAGDMVNPNGNANREVNMGMSVARFSAACAEISVLFNILGVAFAFGGRDYVQKVRELRDVGAQVGTLPELVERDMAMGTVRRQGSPTRNLLRIKRGLDLMRILFQLLLQDSSRSLRECAAMAYDAVFSKYHSWSIKSLVAAGMYMLPTKDAFLRLLHHDELSWREPAQAYVEAVGPIIVHVEHLFVSRNIGLDW